MVIGMPPGLPPYWQKKRPLKKNHSREQGESFPSEERSVSRAESVHAWAVFLLAGHNIAPGGRDAG